MDPYVEKILTSRVYDVAIETPLQKANSISRKLHNEIFLKREDQQSVFSFKNRGAYNTIFHLKQANPELSGVICASAGNHAQGVANGAKHLGLKSVIVMPKTTPQLKVEGVKSLGGEVVLHGDAFDDAYAHAVELQKQHGYAFVHPFDAEHTIAGQGTVGMEIVQQHPEPLDAVFVQIGGGGLAAGVSVLIKSLWPNTKVIGVEPHDAACMQAALKAGKPVDIGPVGIFADGCAVRIAGTETHRVCSQYLDEVITANTDEICAAIKDVFDDTRAILEPSGALALAGAKKYIAAHQWQGKRIAVVTSGANVNFDRLRHVTERAEIGEQREAILAVTIPEQPGSFRQFCQLIGDRQVTEFNYRFSDSEDAKIFVGVQVMGAAGRQVLLDTLHTHGLNVVDMTDNEVAKLHTRHMVGGRAPMINDERVFRFEFPERPGALAKFLDTIADASNWNISLFHYRNHGSAYGRVLVGIQVPPADNAAFEACIDGLGYQYHEESDNEAYLSFLR